MKFKISSQLLKAAGEHAAQRGITLEEYIQEFIGILQDEQAKGNVDMDSKSIQEALQAHSKL
tara:strand:+ start:5010 stop:5195 length:186 start_codon:yes stop_codon:yes gene_type:complete